MPNETTTEFPETLPGELDVASVMTSCTGPLKALGGTVTLIVLLPTTPEPLPPVGWMVVVETTVPATPPVPPVPPPPVPPP